MNPLPSSLRAAALALVTALALAGCALPWGGRPAASPDLQSERVARIEAFASRLRDANQDELLDEWHLAQRAPEPARTALLKLHPVSPVYDPDGGLALLGKLDAGEQRAVLRGWADIVASVRQADVRARDEAERAREQSERAREQSERAREQVDRAREQLAAQAERQRAQLREAERRAFDDRQRLDAERQRIESERQRAEVLAARLDELQRTMQALRDIDRRQVNRTP